MTSTDRVGMKFNRHNEIERREIHEYTKIKPITKYHFMK